MITGNRVLVRVAVEAVEVGESSMHLVLFVSEGGAESRVSIPIVADDARVLADALFVGAKRVDPRGHEAMIDRIAGALSQPVGGVH